MALPFFFLTNNYSKELIDTCGKIYDIIDARTADVFPDCVNFINIEGVSEYFIKKGDWEFKYEDFLKLDRQRLKLDFIGL